MPETSLTWRLLEDGIEDPFLHFAVEETLLRRVAEGRSEPTLRLRRYAPSVWIGVYQDPGEDVNLDYCRAHGLPVVRRPNPGGAVYQDRGTFCYSALFRKHPAFQALGIAETRELYGLMGGVVEDLCAHFGVRAQASPVNDVLVGRRKVYGSAQVELGDGVVHSGTFLVHADLEAMVAALHPSRLKYADRGFLTVRERVVNLAEAAGRALPVQAVKDQFVRAFQSRLPVALEPGGLTGDEALEAQALAREKYAREEWTFPCRRPFTTSLAARTSSGVVRLDLVLEGDRVASLAVLGDFLVERQEDLAALVERVAGRTLHETQTILGRSPLPVELREAIARLLTESFQRPARAETVLP